MDRQDNTCPSSILFYLLLIPVAPDGAAPVVLIPVDGTPELDGALKLCGATPLVVGVLKLWGAAPLVKR